MHECLRRHKMSNVLFERNSPTGCFCSWAPSTPSSSRSSTYSSMCACDVIKCLLITLFQHDSIFKPDVFVLELQALLPPVDLQRVERVVRLVRRGVADHDERLLRVGAAPTQPSLSFPEHELVTFGHVATSGRTNVANKVAESVS